MENNKIKEILDFLKKKFPENWVENYIEEVSIPEVEQTSITTSKTENPETKSISEEAPQQDIENNQVIDEESLTQIVNNCIDSCFDFLYISVLSGEYISNIDFSKDLHQLERFLDMNFDAMVDSSIQAILDVQIKNNLVGSIKIALNLYKNFTKILDTSFKHPNLDVIAISTPAISKLINDNSIKNPIKDKLEFFLLLISVSKEDHFLRDDIRYYNNLIEIEHYIKISTTPPTAPNKFSVVLREKVQYLKYKWEIRQRTLYGKKKNNYVKAYLTDDELIIIDSSTSTRNTGTSFSKWQNYLEPHYELGEWKSKIETEANKIDKVNLKNNSILKLHTLIKYYKDVCPNYSNLSEVVSEIKKRLKNEKFEVHTYNKIYSYALNNQFSLLLEQKDVTDEKINELKNKIDSFQNKTTNDNFFAEYKYISLLLNKIEEAYKTRKVLDNIETTKNLIDKVEQMIQQYSKNLSWTDNHYHCVFQLPFKESLVECGIAGLNKIYYASSFVLPLSRSESQDNFEELVLKHNKLATSIKVIASLSKEFSRLKETETSLEETKESLKDNDFKSIEVIGIFTAIMTVIMATVPALKYIDSIWVAVLFYISIASSLGMFLLIIFSIRKGVDELKKNATHIISFFAILCIIIFSLVGICNNVTQSTKQNQPPSNTKINSKVLETSQKKTLKITKTSPKK